MFETKRQQEWLMGLGQAGGVLGYCGLVGVLFWQGNEVFGRMNTYLAVVMFLLLFCVSALVCGLMVIYYPYQLFSDKKKKQAGEVVMWTAGWLMMMLVIIMGIVVVM